MKLTTQRLKQLIKEELAKIIDEGLTKPQRERAKTMTYNGATFNVVPLNDQELEDADPKIGIPKERFFGIYQVKYTSDINKQSLYNAIVGYSQGKRYTGLFNYLDFPSWGIKVDPSNPFGRPYNFVVTLYDEDDANNKDVFMKIKNDLEL